MRRSRSGRWRRPLLVILCCAVLAGPLLWYAARHGDGAAVVPESSRSGWRTIRHDGVQVSIPAAWERFDRSRCEFRFASWAPPGSDECAMAGGLAFYASATFDPAHGPGVARVRQPGEPDWGGYTYAGEYAVYVADDDREVVQRVLASVR